LQIGDECVTKHDLILVRMLLFSHCRHLLSEIKTITVNLGVWDASLNKLPPPPHFPTPPPTSHPPHKYWKNSRLHPEISIFIILAAWRTQNETMPAAMLHRGLVQRQTFCLCGGIRWQDMAETLMLRESFVCSWLDLIKICPLFASIDDLIGQWVWVKELCSKLCVYCMWFCVCVCVCVCVCCMLVLWTCHLVWNYLRALEAFIHSNVSILIGDECVWILLHMFLLVKAIGYNKMYYWNFMLCWILIYVWWIFVKR
jgi:hypothetical protein